jgi:heme/copper-type cytochrome/quinol oxidase subunit 2
MKKIIIILIVLSFLFVKQVYGQDQEPPPCVCCAIPLTVPGGGVQYKWIRLDNCPSIVDYSICKSQNLPKPDDCEIIENPPSQPSQPSQPPTLRIPEEKIKPGEVKVTWTSTLISVCPPGILRIGGPCEKYPTLEYLIATTTSLILKISPPLLVLLIILGGLMYLLTPFNVEEYIKRGHNYIKYAVFGYILLLLVTLIFTIISAFLGGPSP